MIDSVVPAFLFCMLIITYLLELWLGFAFSGWASKNMLVERAEKPGPYWFIMTLQTIILFAIPFVLAFSG